MILEQAKDMALNLMRHYSVYDYEFEWMQRRERFCRAGQCDYHKRIIQLSPVFVELNQPFIVKRTILHEIAHAIAGQKHGHNIFWKRTARLLGDDGGTRYGKEVKRSPMKKDLEAVAAWEKYKLHHGKT